MDYAQLNFGIIECFHFFVSIQFKGRHQKGYWTTMLYIGTGPSQFCGTSAKITDWVIIPLDGLYHFVKGLWLEGGNFDNNWPTPTSVYSNNAI